MEIIEIDKLVESLKLLPGVGEKTARRYAYDILDYSTDEQNKLIENVTNIQNVSYCSVCGFYTTQPICSICLDEEREKEKLIVVAFPKDIIKIEQVMPNKYKYFSLGAIIDPLNGYLAEHLNLEKLKQRIQKDSVKDILLVLPMTNEGEITSAYLKRYLKDEKIRFTKLAQGVPVGANLEYLDEITLLKSIQSAQEY